MHKTAWALIGGLLILMIAGGALAAYVHQRQQAELGLVRTELARAGAEAEETRADLAARLDEKSAEAIALAGELRKEQRKNGTFESQLRDLAGSIGTLEKLAATDPELLAKYSKVYFLNENYVPARLASLPSAMTLQPERTYELHASVASYLTDLLEDAQDDDLSLLVVSAYRSFDSQAALKSSYQVRYGSGANAFSADQGYSEHQLGTAVDFTTPAVGGSFSGFDRTDEFAWLTENAWRYGFILSYPAGNSYYQYEPWHWRFVGRELAERLHEDDEAFYDLDQRAIDEYLVNLFD